MSEAAQYALRDGIAVITLDNRRQRPRQRAARRVMAHLKKPRPTPP